MFPTCQISEFLIFRVSPTTFVLVVDVAEQKDLTDLALFWASYNFERHGAGEFNQTPLPGKAGAPPHHLYTR